MQEKQLMETEAYTKKNKRRQIWKMIVRSLACIVVFCTTYALILPAITQERDVYCGMEEHEHTDACYKQLPVEDVLVCEVPEIVVHEHTDACYVSVMETETQTSAQIEESIAVHEHEASCYEMVRGELECGLEETEGHQHGEDCFVSEELICELEEVPAHLHGDACYAVTEVLVCDLPEGEVASEETMEEAETQAEEEETRVLICTEPEETVHVHEGACFQPGEQPLTCALAEDENHTHTTMCYGTWELICEKEVHKHELACYSDKTADVETEEDWIKSFGAAVLTGDFEDDVLAIAKTQLGYMESTKNYIVMEDGETVKGYTRYGAWYGDPYGDWCAMFAAFCLNYAGAEDVPTDSNCNQWIELLLNSDLDLYRKSGAHVPEPGQLIFFDWDADGSADHVGIVAEYTQTDAHNAAWLQCIEGNSNNTVRYTEYALEDPSIMGYGLLKSQIVETPVVEEELPETTEEFRAAVANLVAQTTRNAAMFSLPGRTDTMTATTFTVSARNTAITGTTTMDNLIKLVTVYKKQNGTWVEVGPNDTVTQGEDLLFTIHYTVDGRVLSNSTDKPINTLVYKIPDSIKHVVRDADAVYDDQDNEVGSFVIDPETNTITITFYDEYVAENQLNKAIKGTLSFHATVESVTQEDDGKSDILFSDKVKIELEVVKKEDAKGDVKVEKSITEVKGNQIFYKIIITSETGTFSDVVLTDEMTGGLKALETTFIVKDKHGNTVTPVIALDSTTKKFAMTLPKMNAGDSYVITYTAELDDEVESHTLIENKAVVNSTNNQGMDISDDAKVDHTFKFVNKSGKLLGVDPETGKNIIQWTILINEDKADISGAILRDYIIDTDGTRKNYTGKVTIKDSQGNVLANPSLPYTFPSGSKDTYTITYTTSHESVWGENGVTNWAGLYYNDENDNFWDSGWVGIGTKYPIEKDGEVIGVDSQTGKILVQWNVTLDTSTGSLPAYSVIHDAMDSGQYMTYAQLKQLFAAVEEAIKPYNLTISEKQAATPDGVIVRGNDIDLAGDSNVYDQFYIQIRQEIPKNALIEFSYEVTADGPPEYGYFYNYIAVNYKIYYTGSAKYDHNKPTIIKYGVDVKNDYNIVGDNTELDYDDLPTEYEGFAELNEKLKGGKSLCWFLRLQTLKGEYTEAIKIIDTLPEGVELVSTVARIWGSYGEQQFMFPDETGYSRVSWYGNESYKGYGVQLQTSRGEDGRQIITYTVEADLAYLLSEHGSILDFYVICKFRDDFEWGGSDAVVVQVPFTNAVRMGRPNGELFNTYDHTFIINYDKSDEFVSKVGESNKRNELEYKVVLNKNGYDLDPNSGTIKVKDVLRYVSPAAWPVKLYLKPGSVNVYDYTGGVKGELISSARYTYTEASSGEGDITYTHTLDMVLPDSQAMLLEYVYKVDGIYNENYSYDMMNTCTILGVAEGSVDDEVQIEVKVYKSSAEANFDGIYIYKVDAYNNKLYLPGAVFNLYTWDKTKSEYVRVKHPNTDGKKEEHYAFTTDEDGCLVLNEDIVEAIAYNAAYYITEITAPSGYFKNPQPYYFYIYSKDTAQNPENFPVGFKGDKLNTGALIFYYNEPATTELVVRKKWQDHNGQPITVKAEQVESVSFELWQKLDGVEGSDKLYGTYTITPDANGFWEKTIKDLPKGIVNPEDGTKGTLYLYYIKEVSVSGYAIDHYTYDDGNDTTIDDSGGINAGTIAMTNQETEGYELPETGGIGTTLYTAGGLLLTSIGTGASLLYKYKKRRKEDFTSS